MNDLEQAFDNGYRKYLSREFMRISQANIPFFALKGNIRFKPKQMPDRILVSFHQNLCFELKRVQTDSLPLANIKPHQIAFLSEFQQKAGQSYFIFAFMASQKVFLVPITLFCKLIRTSEGALIVNTTGRKSLHIKDLQKLDVKEIPMEVMQKHFRLNLEGFLEETIMSFL